MKEKLIDDVEKYISKRKRRNKIFAKDFEVGYENFKIGVLLKQAREDAGISQAELANRLNTHKSAISRIENHSEDIRLSTLNEYLEAVGKKLSLRIL
jgi:ribosome-binding protein aMBF1 (putative translation factor)